MRAIWLDTFCVVLSDTRLALSALHIAILITPSTFPRAVGRVWKFPKTFGTTWARSRLHHDKLYRLWHWVDARPKPIMLHEVPIYKKDNLKISLVFLRHRSNRELTETPPSRMNLIKRCHLEKCWRQPEHPLQCRGCSTRSARPRKLRFHERLPYPLEPRFLRNSTYSPHEFLAFCEVSKRGYTGYTRKC